VTGECRHDAARVTPTIFIKPTIMGCMAVASRMVSEQYKGAKSKFLVELGRTRTKDDRSLHARNQERSV
jgi:hypothetical protein